MSTEEVKRLLYRNHSLTWEQAGLLYRWYWRTAAATDMQVQALRLKAARALSLI